MDGADRRIMDIVASVAGDTMLAVPSIVAHIAIIAGDS